MRIWKLILRLYKKHFAQISKSFLRKLIRTRRIKSYKLGRLRRFSLEDILEYLTRNEYLENPSIRS